jgi:crossover junction endodeoxyribonuclease RuvC
MTTRILGIDPGFGRMGICVLEKDGPKESLLFSACISTPKDEAFEARLGTIGSEVDRIIREYGPDELAMEKLFFAKNQTTAINVAEVRGVVLYLSHLHGLSVHEYSPPQIKMSIAGHGKASKRDMAHMVPRILGKALSGTMLDDELDAIAIALTHSAHRRLGTLTTRR